MRLSYLILTLVAFLLYPTGTYGATLLQVPFTTQAPGGNWDQPWQDACEESVIAMVNAFYQKKSFTKEEAVSDITHAFRIKEAYYGKSLDEDADQIVSHINAFYPWEARIVETPSLAEIKHEIDQGRPVILPTYGRALLNPYFQDGGPNYHTIVISGYDDTTQEFITQEPGTQYGEDYRYAYTTLMEAMHDFVEGRRTETGRKVAIFTTRQSTYSLSIDGDADGLTKEQEFGIGTDVASPDTDRDGYSDFVEIQHGYSPLTNEGALTFGTLVKMATDPRVYLLEEGTKRHILTEEVFFRHNWSWHEVHDVGKSFLQSIPTGTPLS